MKTILETEINGQTLYLSNDGLATDRIENAKEFRCLSDATIESVHLRSDESWGNWGIRFTPKRVLFSEQQSIVAGYFSFDRSHCKSHR
jgi:hypothetical protein